MASEPPDLPGTGRRLARALAGAPATVRVKLVLAFLVIAALLVLVGVLGLRVLGQANARVERLGTLQLRSATYQALEAYATDLRMMLGVRAAGQPTLTPYTGGATIGGGRQWELSDDAAAFALSQVEVGADEATFGFVPPADDERVLTRIRHDYRVVAAALTRISALDRRGVPGYEAQPHLTIATAADNDLTARAVDLAQRSANETTLLIAANRSAYASSRDLVIAVGAISVVLALGLGMALSWSFVGPIQRTEARLAEIAAGEFTGKLRVPNRDELGSLAANVNRMNDELRRLYGELQEASRHKSEFLAQMSHELRTPLNAIIGFSQVLRQRLVGEINAKQEEYLDDVIASGNHLLSLVNEVLDIEKVEAGQIELELTTVSLREALTRSAALVRDRATGAGIRLSLDLAADVDLVEADDRRLQQVVSNLLANAIKFTPSGGSILVATERRGDVVRVSVSDTGPGVADADRERIFEEFQQTPLGVRQGEGTGLGLTLARRFVELHGGRIWMESVLPSGSRFVFTLPLGEVAPS